MKNKKLLINTFAFIAGFGLLQFLMKGNVKKEPSTQHSAPIIAASATQSLASKQGMGKDREFFAKAVQQAEFTRNNDIEGLENFVYRSGSTLYQLIGPKHDLRQASLTVSHKYSESAKASTNANIINSFAASVCPESADWVADAYTRVADTPTMEMEQTFNGMKAKLKLADLGGVGCLIVLIYEAA